MEKAASKYCDDRLRNSGSLPFRWPAQDPHYISKDRSSQKKHHKDISFHDIFNGQPPVHRFTNVKRWHANFISLSKWSLESGMPGPF